MLTSRFAVGIPMFNGDIIAIYMKGDLPGPSNTLHFEVNSEPPLCESKFDENYNQKES